MAGNYRSNRINFETSIFISADSQGFPVAGK
jgi:hypothetical protein